MKQGTGPRHIIVSKDNKFVYLLNELTATVTTLALDAKTGTLKEVDSASALPADTKLGPGQPRGPGGARTDSARCGERHLGVRPASHAGRQIPLRGRAHVELARRLQGRCGERQAHLRRLARRPRSSRAALPIDPSGKFIIVSGEKSETLSSYAIDGATGALKEIGKYPTGKGSNWVEIVSFD